jgi:monofunctional biosynthetic peptidoglycan transglycosylase
MRGRRMAKWMAAHKVRSLLLLALVFACYELLTIPWLDIPRLRTVNPEETALMRQRRREAESEGKTLAIQHQWVPFRRIPRHVVNAVVVAEDGTFWEHGGFDWYEFQQSLKKNWENKRVVRGASTITQQLAKNLYLSTSRDPIRKIKEWLITWLLEAYLDKERILEIYLNVIEWGRGIFGIEAAARAYFHCSASALTPDQAMRLAAVIPSPLKHKPNENSRWLAFRRTIVQQRMMGRRYVEVEEPPDEESETQEQPEENTSSQPSPEPSPADTGNVSEPIEPDSTDIQRGLL